MPHATECLWGKHLLCARGQTTSAPWGGLIQVDQMSVSGKSRDSSADISSLKQDRWESCQWKGAHCEVSLSSPCPTNDSTQLLSFQRTLNGSSLHWDRQPGS